CALRAVQLGGGRHVRNLGRSGRERRRRQQDRAHVRGEAGDDGRVGLGVDRLLELGGEGLQGFAGGARRQRLDLVLDQRRELEHLGVFEVAYDLAVLHRLGVIDADIVDELRETRRIGPCAGKGHREQGEHGEQARVVQHSGRSVSETWKWYCV